MRVWGVVLFFGLFAAMWSATAAADSGRVDIGSQAGSASIDRQPELYMKAAQEELKATIKLYDQNQTEDAVNSLNRLVGYSDQAAAAATRSRKRVKNTEIGLRKISEKLLDVKRTLSFEDQAPVQAAMDHLETLRTKLLTMMFSKEKK